MTDVDELSAAEGRSPFTARVDSQSSARDGRRLELPQTEAAIR